MAQRIHKNGTLIGHSRLTLGGKLNYYKFRTQSLRERIQKDPLSSSVVTVEQLVLRTDSIAVWTALSLLMQLGDRHCGNFLVDRSTGVLHCIDFEALFDSGVNLAVPESMFCRLTPVIRALIPQGMFETRFKDVVH